MNSWTFQIQINLVCRLVCIAYNFGTGQPRAIDFDPAVDVSFRSKFAALLFNDIARRRFDTSIHHEELPYGWMSSMSAYIVASISRIQRHLGISGGVGEIGVHHGLFFVALAHTAMRHEHLFACDVFSHQHLNVDNSGFGDRVSFESNLRKFGIGDSHVEIYEGASSELSISGLFHSGAAPFRLLSIDGGHDASTTLGDLKLAEQVLLDGGVVVLDDFSNDVWMGVREGFFQYMFQEGLNESRSSARLVPFLLWSHKLYLTTESHHHTMLASLRDYSVFKGLNVNVLPESEHAGGLTSLVGWPVAVRVPHAVEEANPGIGFKQNAIDGILASWQALLLEKADEVKLNLNCWAGRIQPEVCCDARFGRRGNENCWDGAFTYESCCLPSCWEGIARPELCCDLAFGPEGYNKCWLGMEEFSYDACCRVRVVYRE